MRKLMGPIKVEPKPVITWVDIMTGQEIQIGSQRYKVLGKTEKAITLKTLTGRNAHKVTVLDSVNFFKILGTFKS
jgi:hypothetical protein